MVVGKEGIVQQLRHYKAIIYNYILYRKQCEHLTKLNLLFCSIHRNYCGVNVVLEVFATLHNRDECIRKICEAQLNLNRLKERGVRIPRLDDCAVVLSIHADMFKSVKENLAREIKEDVIELRVVVKMKEEEEKKTQALFDQLPIKRHKKN